MSAFEVMGIVNVTPDSFSDGGQWLDPEKAVAHGLELAEQGAAILDIGGESTRPGAEPVGVAEELRRVLPVIEGLVAARPAGIRISIDTAKAQVALRALEAGADIVNDVTGLTGDQDMKGVVAAAGCEVCVMHMQGEPRTMQTSPTYGDVVSDIRDYLQVQVEGLVAAGIEPGKVWLDPGIGFGKTTGHNLELLNRLDEIVALGHPVLVGASRKAFIGKVSGAETGDRLPGSLAAIVIALERGARIFRVHDVAQSVQALEVAAASLLGESWESQQTT
ncbi:MAG: dihydropteroate synthase [Solirubrobacterales bacterium]|nr:dihydropteroate synthase [Solirubrobacterales bacterium]